ncbi:uncharacterized protein LOC114321351 [Camellia sinensis]|uniref:uncharacterized protein LOC114321351 n=1 Tax=Camellia sinensis TaxID=4442 RepID=UPI00103619BE|nr:uncharacterized protein LOC114321351 [Camellia sinensis]
MEKADKNTIIFLLLSITESGVRFPLHLFLKVVLRYWGLILSQSNVNFFRIIMGVIELNRRLRLNLGIPSIRHCYVLVKLSGRQGRSFLRAKDIDHHSVTMLASSGKRVDNIMVAVQGNWEFGEGKDRLDPVPRRKGEPGNDLKQSLNSADEAIFAQVKIVLEFIGGSNLQGDIGLRDSPAVERNGDRDGEDTERGAKESQVD